MEQKTSQLIKVSKCLRMPFGIFKVALTYNSYWTNWRFFTKCLICIFSSLKSFKIWLTHVTYEIQWTSMMNPDLISPHTRARSTCSTPHNRGKLLKYTEKLKNKDMARTTSIQSPPGLSHTDSREPQSQVHQMSGKRGVDLQGSGCSVLGLRGAGRLSLDTNAGTRLSSPSAPSLSQLGVSFSDKSWQGSETTSMNGFSQRCCRIVCTHHVTGFR